VIGQFAVIMQAEMTPRDLPLPYEIPEAAFDRHRHRHRQRSFDGNAFQSKLFIPILYATEEELTNRRIQENL
jgi:hypothetical protein